MKVLMFGWEFPPHILGGLGTASYGLTKGMSQQDDLEITFCIPKDLLLNIDLMLEWYNNLCKIVDGQRKGWSRL